MPKNELSPGDGALQDHFVVRKLQVSGKIGGFVKRVLKIVPVVHSRGGPPDLGQISGELLKLLPSNKSSNGSRNRKAANGRA